MLVTGALVGKGLSKLPGAKIVTKALESIGKKGYEFGNSLSKAVTARIPALNNQIKKNGETKQPQKVPSDTEKITFDGVEYDSDGNFYYKDGKTYIRTVDPTKSFGAAAGKMVEIVNGKPYPNPDGLEFYDHNKKHIYSNRDLDRLTKNDIIKATKNADSKYFLETASQNCV